MYLITFRACVVGFMLLDDTLQAQERLLLALRERNQATVAACLQIYFNLQSLPEIVLLAVDHTVRQTVELSKELIDLESIAKTFPDLSAIGADGKPNTNPGVLALIASGTAAGGAGGKKGGSSGGVLHGFLCKGTEMIRLLTGGNLRLAIRDMAHNWSSVVFEQAMQIQALQKVLAKKEDPTTHKTFISVLRSSGATGTVGSSLLAGGKILDLYWERLTEAMQEIVSDKLRVQPYVAIAVYPHLRKAAVDLVDNLQLLSAKESAADVVGLFDAALLEAAPSGGTHTNAHAHTQQYEGEFGSLYWNQSFLFEALGLGKRLHSRQQRQTGEGTQKRPQAKRSLSARHQTATADDASQTSDAASGDANTGLVASFRPFRDRYLGAALNRMNDPIIRMFPEVEGYVGA
jgi:hypothetical protein